MVDKLNQSDIAELHDAFRLFDKNNDGFISYLELKDIMHSLGRSPTEREVKDMMREIDTDGDGTINFAEFLVMMGGNLKKTKRDPTDELKQCFRLFDRDNDGYITHSEMRRALDQLGEKITDTEIEEMIREADTDGNDKVDYQEFLGMMMKQREGGACS